MGIKLSVLACAFNEPKNSQGHPETAINYTQVYISSPRLGKDGCTKSDEFSEKFQTTFDPPPSCSEN